MLKKNLKGTCLALLVTAVLCAGTVSARQLRSGAKNFVCGGSCGFNNPCPKGCLCIFPMESNNAFCASHPIPGATVIK